MCLCLPAPACLSDLPGRNKMYFICPRLFTILSISQPSMGLLLSLHQSMQPHNMAGGLCSLIIKHLYLYFIHKPLFILASILYPSICIDFCVHIYFHNYICINTHLYRHLDLWIIDAVIMIIISAILLCSCVFLILFTFPSLRQFSLWYTVLSFFPFHVVSKFFYASIPSSGLLSLLIRNNKYWKTFILYCVKFPSSLCFWDNVGLQLYSFGHHPPSVEIIGTRHRAQLVIFL